MGGKLVAFGSSPNAFKSKRDDTCCYIWSSEVVIRRIRLGILVLFVLPPTSIGKIDKPAECGSGGSFLEDCRAPVDRETLADEPVDQPMKMPSMIVVIPESWPLTRGAQEVPEFK